ncbi:MAG: hypothetical protein IKX65_00825 [Prevotella sp.]|nr:hypothetical protein [Prevotella sp.]
MKRHIFYIFTSMVVMLLLASCVKDRLLLLPEDDPEYYNPDEWKLGTMIVNTDWSRTDLGVAPSDNYFLLLNEDTYLAEGVTNIFRHMHPETYNVFAYYDPQGIHIEDNVATVDNESDGTLLRTPGTLMVSNFEEAKVMRSDTTYVNLVMRQLVHEVTVSIYMWPGDEQYISSITGSIDGIAQAVDITTGEVVSDYNSIISLPLTLTYTPYNGKEEELQGQSVPTYTCTIRIIDIIHSSTQPMELHITYSDGTEATMTINLENILDNISKKDDVTKVELDYFIKTESGIRTSIIDWHVIDEGHHDIK